MVGVCLRGAEECMSFVELGSWEELFQTVLSSAFIDRLDFLHVRARHFISPPASSSSNRLAFTVYLPTLKGRPAVTVKPDCHIKRFCDLGILFLLGTVHSLVKAEGVRRVSGNMGLT